MNIYGWGYYKQRQRNTLSYEDLQYLTNMFILFIDLQSSNEANIWK
jgi:hypothetical protein